MMSLIAMLLAAQPAPLQLSRWEDARCARGSTNDDLQACASDRLRAADRILNQEWQAVVRMLKDADVEAQKRGDDKSFGEALQAQRAWLQYRGAQCQAVHNSYGRGSHAPLARLLCLDRLTRARAVELRDMQRP